MRIRTIKPEFFRHEKLALLHVKTRLLFIGLWCIADAEGRLEDRPQRIRVEIFPYDTSDIDSDLEELASAGFIARYTAQSLAIIEVTAFKKHQRITGKEAKYVSKLPPRDVHGSNGETPEKQQPIPGCVTDAQERKKEEGKKKQKSSHFSPDEFDHLLSRSMLESTAFLDAWHRWTSSRHQRRKRISESAAKSQIKAIHTAGIPAGIRAIETSIASDWTGLFPDNAPGAAPIAATERVQTFAEMVASGQIKPLYRGPRVSLFDQNAADEARNA